MLSIIPGLGQIYNGESRKGMLFMGVAVANLIVFLCILFGDPILRWLVWVGQSNHMKSNRELIGALQQIHIFSPVSIIVIGLFIAFIAYSVRDAYDQAVHLQRKRIYPEYVMELSEAGSGSYLFHIATMLCFFVLAFFFLIPKPPATQVTDIEFIQNQPPTKKKIVSPRKAQTASENSGKHEKKEVVAPSPCGLYPSKTS